MRFISLQALTIAALSLASIPALATDTRIQAPPDHGSGAPAVVVSPEPPPIMLAAPESANISLTSASVYVYDFLDRREDVYSSKVLDEFERQLLAWLGAKAKAVTLLRSNQTPFMLATKAGQADDWSASINVDQTTQRVPVMDAIASNAAVEDSFGADHQLIVFPTSFSSTGAWRSYIIRWEVIRKSDRKTWQYMYSGRHMVMWSDNERSESRAKKFVDGVNQAMETDGLLNASPKQP